MRNVKIEDFYTDSECTQLKKSFSVDYHKEIGFDDFDLDGWTFVGFKEAVETNIPSNMKYDVEPERYYVLDFYPIGDRQYTLCEHYDPEDKRECKFSNAKRIYQIKVSQEFLHNFIKNGLYAYQSLKSVIQDVIENDKYYSQSWYSMPFKLLDDTGRYEKTLKEVMKNRIKKEVKKGNLTIRKAEASNKSFENIINRKSELLDTYYYLNPSHVSQEYVALTIERRNEEIAKERARQAKLKYRENKKAKELATQNGNEAESPTTETTEETSTSTETTKSDKTKG